ncbi:MAG: zf-HC2 domain-containing protein [Fimbriimonadaceae bacterium]|nr:zf-HC2 domain-containing protein [Fimbriimonadaceae bacterium]QYK56715.1 MAG: zf-HC2 domain-containing protein [Fimbriimonadaceae bacterium]
MPEPMDCREAFEKLQDYIDRELCAEEYEAVRAHLERCPPCKDEFVFEGSVLRCLKEKLAEMQVPEDLMARLCQCLEKEG